MKKFEYKIESLNKKFTLSSLEAISNIESQLNKLGEEGWELTALQGNTIFLKREINE